MYVEVIQRTLSPSPVLPEGPAALVFDNAAALDLVGGDEEALQQVKDLCIAETPRLLDEIERALTEAQADALSTAAHTLRGMCLVFGSNEVVTIAGRMEELAETRDLTTAAIEYEGLRPAAALLMDALRSPQHALVVHS